MFTQPAVDTVVGDCKYLTGQTASQLDSQWCDHHPNVNPNPIYILILYIQIHRWSIYSVSVWWCTTLHRYSTGWRGRFRGV